ncbi:MAG: metallophosphatase family protein [Actinomycetota bacterium]|nr:metallophosphatase family protein [Actinomycetota bacterium]
MRPRAPVAALYDVHGNLPALEAVLADLTAIEPELVLVGGDIVSGPMPRETLDLLLALGERAVFIRGNADRQAADRSGASGDDVWAARDRWTGEQLTDEQRSFLARLPETARIAVETLGPVLFCHGSPRSDEEIVTRATPEERMREMLAGVDERVVVLGHTHVQFDRTAGGRRVVNAGSVGMPYADEPGAYWALLGPDVELRRSGYDVESAAERIRATGFPGGDEFAREHVLTVVGVDEATDHFERRAEAARR